ncbi:hypothetical protein [Priestia aryabhattai]
MNDKQIDELVDELVNNRSELREYINNVLPEATEDHIESLVDDLDGNPVELFAFIAHSIDND